ncbi:MAG: hypothetical protein AAF673_00700 [Pseudomonadota bacterium]
MLLSNFSFAQDFTGHWKGLIKKLSDDKIFELEFVFEQTGMSIKGISIIKDRSNGAYGVMTLTGRKQYSGGISFEEIGVVGEQTALFWTWCLKYGKLSYDPIENKLYGFSACIANGVDYGVHDVLEVYRIE